MIKSEAKERIEKLRSVINHHRYLYHVLNRPEISDEALDSLKKELFDLEQEFPEFITSDSPTQRVAGEPLKGFGKVTHPGRMISLNDSFSADDLLAWKERLDNFLHSETIVPPKTKVRLTPKSQAHAIAEIYYQDRYPQNMTEAGGR